jgi:hypothetical protein
MFDRRTRWGALVAAIATLAALAPSAGALPSPSRVLAPEAFPGSGWCGTDATAEDRPPVVGGSQIHVVYGYPADGQDRFGEWLPKILPTLAAVDDWWRGQDPTRRPRFDLAQFPGCSSRWGALDIADVKLAMPSGEESGDKAVYSGINVGPSAPVLLFFDGPKSDAACGRSGPWFAVVFLNPANSGCVTGGWGTINGWPAATTAHELIHVLTNDVTSLRSAHACADHLHVCDDPYDILNPNGDTFGSARSLAQTRMDVAHDDYFDTLHNSPAVAHADAQDLLSVRIKPERGGTVTTHVPEITCPPSCESPWDPGAPVDVTAFAQPGFAFAGWSGACATRDAACRVTADGVTRVEARFVRARHVLIRVRGSGGVFTPTGTCQRRCTHDVVPGSRLELFGNSGLLAHLDHWEGACSGERRRCVVRVTKNVTVTAVFRRD